MYMDHEMKWEDIYAAWQVETKKFPALCGQLRCLKVEFPEPRFGPCYYYNWAKKEEEGAAIQRDLTVLASGWPEIGTNWSKGTIRTASLLCDCETEEELAAVWLTAFALSITRCWTGTKGATRNAWVIERESYPVFARKYDNWHTNSREFFPETYLPTELFWGDNEISVRTLIALAAMNAALVMAHYTPVEYKRAK